MVGLGCIPDSVKPSAMAANTPAWQSTAVIWALGVREQHSNDSTSQEEGILAAQTLGASPVPGKQGTGVVWLGQGISAQPLLCFLGHGVVSAQPWNAQLLSLAGHQFPWGQCAALAQA